MIQISDIVLCFIVSMIATLMARTWKKILPGCLGRVVFITVYSVAIIFMLFGIFLWYLYAHGGAI